MAENLPLTNGVLVLERFSTSNVIGYIFGGIASTLPYPGKATCASNKVYAVILDPRKGTTTVPINSPAGAVQ
jgi:hypothetical protein